MAFACGHGFHVYFLARDSVQSTSCLHPLQRVIRTKQRCGYEPAYLHRLIDAGNLSSR